MHRAVATSLCVIALVGLSGVVSAYWHGRELPVALTLLFAGGGLLGMVLGQGIARYISTFALQKIFIGLILITAGLMYLYD
jgi:uncharacterized membrane protein YfcA